MPVVTTKNPTVADQNTTTMQGAQTASQAGAAQTATGSTIPYEQNGQLTPIIKPPKVTSTAQGNKAVMQTAQQQALDAQNKPNETMGLVQQSVQGLLKNPLGYDAKQYQQNQLEQYDRNRASSMLAYQQGTADTSNTGINREKAYQYAMQGAQGRSDLENKVAQEQADKQRDAMLQALTAGQSVSQTQSGLDDSAFNKLLNTRAQYEGERAQTTAITADTERLNQIYGQDIAKLLVTQDWQGAQNKIAQDFELAKQSNDINATASNIQKQIDLDKWKQENGQTFTAEQNAINNALQVSLKSMDIQSQTNLMTLKNQLDTGMLIREQDFQAVQADLERQSDIALQAGDFAGQTQLTTLKGQIDSAAQKAQQEWNTAERTATQTWQTGENISKQDADKAAQYFDASIKQAMQDNDIATQKYLEDQRDATQLHLQTQDMGQEEKMAYINSKIAEAKADGDENRQANLLWYTTQQDLTKMTKEQGYTEANMQLQNTLAQALQNNDAVNVMALTKAKQIFDSSEAELDRAITQQKADFEGKMIESEIGAKTFEQIEKAVANGQIAPEAAAAAVQNAAKQYGITIKAPDPMAAQKKADQDWADQLHMYGLTHPDSVVKDAKGNETLKPDALQAYTNFVNSTIYGTDGTPQDTLAKIASGEVGIETLRGKAGTEAYKAILGEAIKFDTAGSSQNDNAKFNQQIPASGSLININGTLYQAGGVGATRTKTNDNRTINGVQFFWVTDVNTGKTYKLDAVKGITG